MNSLLYLVAGGIIGTIGRYYSVAAVQRLMAVEYPYGTLFVNMLGSLLIGFALGLAESHEIGVQWRVFLFIGLFGSFTTFSSFTMQSMNLMRAGEWSSALSYILISNVLGLLFVYGGHSASRFFA